MNNRITGNVGEKVFSALIELQGMVPISSKENDVLGWDFLVASSDKTPPSQTTPLSGIAEFKIQLKAANKLTSIPAMKLSTLRDLVQNGLPAFIVCVEVLHTVINKAYVIHVFDEVIDFVMKAVRTEIDCGGNLHKKRIVLPKHFAEVFDKNVDFDAVFRSRVDMNLARYADVKLKRAVESGFTKRTITYSASKDDVERSLTWKARELPSKEVKIVDTIHGFDVPVASLTDVAIPIDHSPECLSTLRLWASQRPVQFDSCPHYFFKGLSRSYRC